MSVSGSMTCGIDFIQQFKQVEGGLTRNQSLLQPLIKHCLKASHRCSEGHTRSQDLRVLISELEVEVLANFFQDFTADLLKVDLSSFSFPEATYRQELIHLQFKAQGMVILQKPHILRVLPSDVSICLMVLETLAAFFSTMNSTSSELISFTYFSFSYKTQRLLIDSVSQTMSGSGRMRALSYLIELLNLRKRGRHFCEILLAFEQFVILYPPPLSLIQPMMDQLHEGMWGFSFGV